ncbi:hypothetical protein CYANOKiyG1_71840 [Okeania sp. KiyG1]|nr:hypothetical protein CYANOKiyG1_71840 [Okeania sp. KiyG1]
MINEGRRKKEFRSQKSKVKSEEEAFLKEEGKSEEEVTSQNSKVKSEEEVTSQKSKVRKKEAGRRKNIVLSEYATGEQDARTTEI